MAAILHSINTSDGGVPKQPAEAGTVGSGGLIGDRQRNLKYHGGPQRAVCLYSADLIAQLQQEGHPIAIGTIGENLTIAGVPWSEMAPGRTLQVGEVVLQLTAFADPCSTIAGSFRDRQFVRISQKLHPGWSRLYAAIVRGGNVRVGDPVTFVA